MSSKGKNSSKKIKKGKHINEQDRKTIEKNNKLKEKENIEELKKIFLEDKKTSENASEIEKSETINEIETEKQKEIENIEETKKNQQEKVKEKTEKTEIKNIAIENQEITEKKSEKRTETISKEEKNIEKTKNKNKFLYIFIIIILCIVIFIFSIIFALLNMKNSNIAKGIKVKNIDISSLSREDAKEKIEKAINLELSQSINIKYQDKYKTSFETEQIEFVYDIENVIEKAYQTGRTGNIIKDNYSLLYAMFFGINFDISYKYNEELLNDFMEDIESKIPGVMTQASYYIEEEELIINKGVDGIGIDESVLKEKIIENIKNRNAQKIIENKEKLEIEIPIKNEKAEPINFKKIYKEIYTKPQDAYYEVEPFKIYPEVNGVDLEIGFEEAKKQIETEQKEEYVFKLKITPPEVTIKDFGFEAFPKLISSFSTKYVASNKNRSKNLEIAANKINGLVLLPGEIFSFNNVVGKRTVEEGYRDAKIYQDGSVVDGLAGGICQISSTLYNSVLLANLEIVERRNHTFTTSYIRAGRDATVVYGKTDFQFKNTRSYPIKIEAIVSNGIAKFNIYSVSFEEQEYEVKIIPVVTQSIPYTIEHIPDPILLPGEQKVEQEGQPGYKVTTYKELIKDGESISKEVISRDTYSPMRSIIKIGQ